VKRLFALLLGGLGLRALFRSRPAPVSGPDPAVELRAKLAEARTPEREPEAAVEPEAAPEDVDARRADVHARARQALDDLKQ
jgi:hypothetical protein